MNRVAALIGVLPVVLFVPGALVQLGNVSGVSMQPTVANEDLILFNKTCSYNSIQRGHVVGMHSPNQDKIIIKRIIGLEGDWVIKRQEGTYVHIPQGHCWIEGDNPQNSIDSNDFGAVPLGLLFAKVTFSLSKMEFIKQEILPEQLKRLKIRPYSA